MQPSDGSAPAPMAVVLLGDDYSPPSQAFYFRQEVWSHFNGSRLVAPNRPDVDLEPQDVRVYQRFGGEADTTLASQVIGVVRADGRGSQGRIRQCGGGNPTGAAPRACA